MILIDLFGTEYMEWAPETIRLEVKDETGIALSRHSMDKIMAVVTLLTTDRFYTDLPAFIQLCNVLADSDFNPLVFDPADCFEMAWAITEAFLLDPPEDPENIFTEDIRRYIGTMVQEEGLVNPPDVLQLAIIDDHNPDPVADFADDPQMYGAFWKNQNDKSNEIRSMLKRQIAELIEELESLRLQDGNTEGLLKRLKRSMTDDREARDEEKRWASI